MTKLYFSTFLLLSRVTRSGDFSPIGLLLRFQKWFAVDVLGYQIELCCRYFWPFLTWQLFGLFFEKFGHFFNLLVTLLLSQKLERRARYLMEENLKVVWAEFSTKSWAVLLRGSMSAEHTCSRL